jgi:hypothetical protein
MAKNQAVLPEALCDMRAFVSKLVFSGLFAEKGGGHQATAYRAKLNGH